MKIITRPLPSNYSPDIDKAVKILREAGCREIYLFGSLARGEINASSDLDIAVKGLSAAEFFPVSGKMMLSLSHPFDLVELDNPKDRFGIRILETEEFICVA